MRLQHFPFAWNLEEVMCIPEAGEPPQLSYSYHPFSLLTFLNKVIEKFIFERFE